MSNAFEVEKAARAKQEAEQHLKEMIFAAFDGGMPTTVVLFHLF